MRRIDKGGQDAGQARLATRKVRGEAEPERTMQALDKNAAPIPKSRSRLTGSSVPGRAGHSELQHPAAKTEWGSQAGETTEAEFLKNPAVPAAVLTAAAPPGPKSGQVTRPDAAVRELTGGFLPLRLRAAASLLLLGLLVEWLLPLQLVPGWTEPGVLAPLIAGAAGFMAVGLFIPPWPAALLLKALVCAVVTAYSVPAVGGPLPDRLLQLPWRLWEDTVLLFHGGIWAMSGVLRTMLLLAGLAMLTSALQALVWIRQWGLGLMFLTAGYRLALYAWFGLDPFHALQRIFAEGLLLAALLTPVRVRRLSGGELSGFGGIGSGAFRKQNEPLSGSRNPLAASSPATGTPPIPAMPASAAGRPFPAAESTSGGKEPVRVRSDYIPPLRWWAASLAAVVLLSALGAGMAADKPRSDQPASWAVAAQDVIRGGIGSSARQDSAAGYGVPEMAAATTGYGIDDRMLGAPLKLDDTPVFSAVSPLPLYWRGETKSVYDGRGWTEDGMQLIRRGIGSTAASPELEAASETSGGKPVTQTVTMAAPASGLPLFASGVQASLLHLQSASPERSLNTYLENAATGDVYPPSANEAVSTYTVRSVLPVTEPGRLRPAGGTTRNPGAASEDASMLFYLQLPASLPARVGELAGQITKEAGPSRYDQVKAVERFLKSRYAYTTETTPPGRGEDFVDQFLFVQKQGYCVHFSTAMAVLLRTQGIPARWVKGFTAGEPAVEGGSAASAASDAALATASARANTPLPDASEGSAPVTYLVRAKDAHAWVEVYFPGAGWVPFDPTPGFSVPVPDAEAGSPSIENAQPGSSDLTEPGPSPAFSAASAGSVLGTVGSSLRQMAAAASSAGSRLTGWPASIPAAAAAAAALALAAALGSRRLGGRIALALALRRYRRAASVAAPAFAPPAPAFAPPASVPLALAPFPPRRRSGAGRAAEPRAAFLAAADALWRLLHRLERRPRPPQQTVRGYAAALAESLPPPQAEALLRLARWDEAARFGSPERWSGPAPDELDAAAARLTAGRSRLFRQQK